MAAESNKKFPFILTFHRFKYSDEKKIKIAKRICKDGEGRRLGLQRNMWFFKFSGKGRQEFFERLKQK